jgi:hypothetical protein
MKNKDLKQFSNQISSEGVLFMFVGPIWQNIVEELAEVVRDKLKPETNPKTAHTVFHIFLELFQNMMHYSADSKTFKKTNETVKNGLIIIGKKEERFYITISNPVLDSNVEEISNHCTTIQSMTQPELKALYKETLKKGPSSSNSKGAGLGIIDIARKSSAPIEFEITKEAKGHSSLYLRVWV